MMHQTRFTLLFVLLALCTPFLGCAIDTNPFPASNDEASSPMPQDSGDMANDANGEQDPNEAGDADTTGDGTGTNGTDGSETPETAADEISEQGRAPYTIFHASQRQILIGEPQSVNANGLVQVFDTNQTELAQTSSASDGSFALDNEVSLPGSIKVQSSNQSDMDTVVQVGLTDATTAAYASSIEISNAWLDGDSSGDSGFNSDSGFSLEKAGNTLELSGSPTTLVPGLTVVLANLSQSMAMAVQVNTDGSFMVWVEVNSRDDIAIFTVEHGGSNGGGTPLMIEAP